MLIVDTAIMDILLWNEAFVGSVLYTKRKVSTKVSFWKRETYKEWKERKAERAGVSAQGYK